MELPPIIERELRLVMKSGEPHKTRFGVTLYGLLVTSCLLMDTGRPAAQVGSTIFKLLLLLSCYSAVVQPVRITADFLSRERRNQTLGLLFLAGLTPLKLFVYKLSGGLMLCLSSLLALLPLFAIPFLTGGISVRTFSAAAFLLPILLLLFVGLSLLGSAMCEDESQAVLIGSGGAVILCLFTPAIYVVSESLGLPVGQGLMLGSPAYTFYMVWTGLARGATWAQFMISAGITLSYAVVALICAGIALKRAWRREYDFKRKALPKYAQWSGWMEPRRKRKVEDMNPYTWLLRKAPGSSLASWTALGGYALIWAVFQFFFPNVLIPLNLLLFAFTANSFVLLMVIYASAQRVGSDRQSGAFELLLTTPLSTNDIIHALFRTTWSRFHWLLTAGSLLNLALVISGFLQRSWTAESAFSYLLAWGIVWALNAVYFRTFMCSSVWIAFNCGRPAYSIFKAGMPVLITLIVLPFTLSFLYRLFRALPTGSEIEMSFVAFMFIFSGVWVAVQSLVRLQRAEVMRQDFRFIARQPVPEPSDPRYKYWDDSKHFPFGKDAA